MKKKVLISLEQEELEMIDALAKDIGLDRGRFIVYMAEEFRPKTEDKGLLKDNRIILKNNMTKEDRDKLLKENGVEFNKFSKEYQFLEDRIKMLPVYIPKI